MSLNDLIAFIAKTDGLVCSEVQGLYIWLELLILKTIGLFLEKKPIHSGRWNRWVNSILILKDEKTSDFTQPLSISLRDVLRAVENTAKK